MNFADKGVSPHPYTLISPPTKGPVMTTTIDSDQTEPLSPEQTARAIREVIAAAGDAGIEQSELLAAIEALEDLAISAALWHEWADELLQIGWDGQELTWRLLV